MSALGSIFRREFAAYFATPIAFTWYVLIGTSITIAVSLAALRFRKRLD